MMSYSWNLLDVARIEEINPDKIGLLATDGKVTANRTILRLASSPVHTKLVENPDLTILDMKHHKKATIDSLLHLINGGKITFNEDVSSLAQELEIHLTKSFKVDAPEVPEEQPKDKDPGLMKLKDGRMSCGLCFKKAFERMINAKRHYKNVHMAKGKNILCRAPGCVKKFKSMDYMKVHMLKAHGISAKMIPSISKTKLTKKVLIKHAIKKHSQKMESEKIDVKEESFEFEDSQKMESEKIDVKEEPFEFEDSQKMESERIDVKKEPMLETSLNFFSKNIRFFEHSSNFRK